MNAKQLKFLNKWLEMKELRERFREKLYQKFMLEFNYNSNHIEGNTLTYGQTELLLLFGKVVGDAKMRDLEEMKAHNVGLKLILDEARSKNNKLTETFIRQVHQILLREDYTMHRQLPTGFTTTYTIHAGTYKTRPNSVITYTGERFEYASPEETPALMYELVKWFNKASGYTPIELAALFHYRYIRIHPFEDGNGRIARLMVNYILARANYPMIVIRSKNKEEYLNALNQCDVIVGAVPSDGANAELQQITPLVTYLEKCIISEVKSDIAILESGKNNEWWHNGEIIVFKNPSINKILEAMINNPRVTILELSEIVGINKSAIQKHLNNFRNKGFIQRIGNKHRGNWHVALKKI